MNENNKKAELGWVMFDWANSSYSLVISTAIFPTFFIAVTDAYIPVFGLNISNSSIYAFSVSIAYLMICLISPILSGIADYSGSRKLFMRLFTTTGSAACAALFFFDGMNHIWFGVSAFIIATSSHAGSLVFYDAFLPELVPPNRRDKLSARGYAYGYIGSVILLIINIIVIQKPEMFGFSNISIEQHIPIRLAFLSVGIWWFGFSQFSFSRLPDDIVKPKEKIQLNKGLNELRKAWKQIKHHPSIYYYLIAFFCYSAGVQTVIYLASAFAEKELHFESSELILVILILQLVAIGGAYLFAHISKLSNNLLSMRYMLMVWIVICVMAYFVQSHMMFYFIAALVGMVLGGIQAISRSTYSKIIPQESKDVNCFFSFYDTVYYTSIVSGTFIFGIVDHLTGNMRYSVLSLAVFFIGGLILLRKVKLNAIAVD